jgi:hypothetical protein
VIEPLKIMPAERGVSDALFTALVEQGPEVQLLAAEERRTRHPEVESLNLAALLDVLALLVTLLDEMFAAH